jgi:predicted NBD/HSP70 family sugar kinase
LNHLVEKPEMIAFDDVLKAFNDGDPFARRIAQDAANAVSFAIACLVSVINVKRILLVGSVTRLGDAWMAMIVEEMKKRALPMLTQETEIAFGELGSKSVILGASALLLTQELGLSLAR